MRLFHVFAEIDIKLIAPLIPTPYRYRHYNGPCLGIKLKVFAEFFNPKKLSLWFLSR
ncbi:hypothetical protein SAMN05518872_10222 [Psychrobacillus sp. OK032]|nr:hypothetical protein SAMN05518872_10222 [Psychrobacillus sp. OK032]